MSGQLVVGRASSQGPTRTGQSGWGAPRIHGELMKLGIDVGETTVVVRQKHIVSAVALSPLGNLLIGFAD